jgi:hypothetical protein
MVGASQLRDQCFLQPTYSSTEKWLTWQSYAQRWKLAFLQNVATYYKLQSVHNDNTVQDFFYAKVR